MLSKYQRYHIQRIISATNDLWKEENSICLKCHDIEGPLNCLFCYCPNYDNYECGGNFVILDNGLKDCSGCLIPHTKEFIEKFYNV